MDSSLSASPLTPHAILMVRPHHFRVNTETEADNAFQQPAAASRHLEVSAYREITEAAAALQALGVVVHLFEDQSEDMPDSVFPNNWISTHPDGRIVLYPMMAPSRRRERRADIVEFLQDHYQVREIVDYTEHEKRGVFLEGTGSMVLDPLHHVAYAAKSLRTDEGLFKTFCAEFDYEPVLFDALDQRGDPIYHTNVIMCIGADFALVGLDLVQKDAMRRRIIKRLESSGRDVIALSSQQIGAFAGNAFVLQGVKGPLLALSQRAYASLTDDQKARLEKSALLAPLTAETIEFSGGSVRCAMAGVHLPPRP